MPKHGKKYRHAVSMLPRGVKLDDPAKALELVKESAFAKFDETVEVSVRLGVDPRHADQVVRGTVVLPHGTGKTVRVLVLAEGDQARAGEEAGADFVGMEHIARIKEGWTDFDVVVATPNVMGQVGQLGRVLGPRGLMPTPKAGTVTMDVGKAVSEVKAGKIEFRVDKTGNVQVPIGKVSFGPDQLAANMAAVMDVIIRQKPASAKGVYIRSVTVSSTMGPGIGIDPNLYRRVAA